jgi:hypothetical protein
MVAAETRGMIASRRGLIVLLAIALVLGVMLVRDLTRGTPTPIGRALAPAFDPDRVTELVWTRGTTPPVKVERTGQGWAWSSGGSVAVGDAHAIADILATLRGARWHRREGLSAAGSTPTTLVVHAGATAYELGIGDSLAGTEQQWLTTGGDAVLVDRWVARALDADPLAIRVHRLVDGPGELAKGFLFALKGKRVNVAGSPRRITEPVTLLPRAELLAGFERAVQAIEIVKLSGPPAAAQLVLTAQYGGSFGLSLSCAADPALAGITSSVGQGCIPRAAAEDLIAAAESLMLPPADVAEPRPVPFDIARVTLIGGAVIDLQRRPLIDGKPADPAMVSELARALALPAEVGQAIDKKPVGTLIVALAAGGEIAIELLGENVVRRAGEPVTLRVTPAVYQALTRDASRYADRSLWNEEPTTIAQMRIDGVTYTRGAVIGEWARTPPGPLDAVRVEAVVTALSALRHSPDVESFRKVHEVALSVVAPDGGKIEHALLIGPPRPGGCMALSGGFVSLPESVCDSIDALAK